MCGCYDNLIAREAYRALYKAFRLPESNFPPRYNMPVMLMPDDYDRWLDSNTSIEEARSLLKPYDEALLDEGLYRQPPRQ
jgi:hypothetical protein